MIGSQTYLLGHADGEPAVNDLAAVLTARTALIGALVRWDELTNGRVVRDEIRVVHDSEPLTPVPVLTR